MYEWLHLCSWKLASHSMIRKSPNIILSYSGSEQTQRSSNLPIFSVIWRKMRGGVCENVCMLGVVGGAGIIFAVFASPWDDLIMILVPFFCCAGLRFNGSWVTCFHLASPPQSSTSTVTIFIPPLPFKIYTAKSCTVSEQTSKNSGLNPEAVRTELPCTVLCGRLQRDGEWSSPDLQICRDWAHMIYVGECLDPMASQNNLSKNIICLLTSSRG